MCEHGRRNGTTSKANSHHGRLGIFGCSSLSLVAELLLSKALPVMPHLKRSLTQRVVHNGTPQHSTSSKLGTSGGELCKPGDGTDHLTEGFLSAGTTPRTLDNDDNVLRLCDGRTQTVGRPEQLDTAHVVSGCVLSWKKEAVRANSEIDEYGLKLVIAFQCALHDVGLAMLCAEHRAR